MKNFKYNNLISTERNGFTLAEVLITLAVIGVVSALTLPTLISKIKTIVNANQRSIIEKRLVTGLNQFNTLENGLSGQTYSDTQDFLNGLAKHFKMSKICSMSELSSCIPYSNITNDEDIFSIKSLNNKKAFGLNDNYHDPAGFITANGTPFIMTLKKDCSFDPDKQMENIQDSGCISVIYDMNGSRKPNKMGEDIVQIGAMGIGYFKKINGVKIAEPAFFPTAMTGKQCLELAGQGYGIKECGYGTDYWASAVKYCYDNGNHLATPDELASIVSSFYTNAQGQHPQLEGTTWLWSNKGYTISDINDIINLGLKNNNGSNIKEDNVAVQIWSNHEVERWHGYVRTLYKNESPANIYCGAGGRDNKCQALCVVGRATAE